MAISPSRLLKKKLIAKITNFFQGEGSYESKLLKKRFYKAFKKHIDVNNPETFNGHILARLLTKRDPRTIETANKVTVLNYVAGKIGLHILPQNYLVIAHPDELDEHYNTLPSNFVMKPSHASGYVKFIHDKDKHSLKELKKISKYWFSIDYSVLNGEWMYKSMPRHVVFEEFLKDSTGDIPTDYKFFCFDGRVKLVKLDVGRFGTHLCNVYGRNWNLLPFELDKPSAGDLPRPVNYDEMIEIAEKLAEDFDFVRVDLYDLGNRVVFGELTHSPGAGTTNRFKPIEFDKIAGKLFEGQDPF